MVDELPAIIDAQVRTWLHIYQSRWSDEQIGIPVNGGGPADAQRAADQKCILVERGGAVIVVAAAIKKAVEIKQPARIDRNFVMVAVQIDVVA